MRMQIEVRWSTLAADDLERTFSASQKIIQPPPAIP
jgi:hypothetical protein